MSKDDAFKARYEQLSQWLTTPGDGLSAEGMLEQLALRLRELGVPVERALTGVPTMHPEVAVRALMWTLEQGQARVSYSHAFEEAPEYAASPVALIRDKGVDLIRRRLSGDEAQLDFLVCAELAEDGYTDYVGFAMPMSSGVRSFLSWATKAPDGFSDQHIELLSSIRPLLSLRGELESAQFAVRALLRTYLGPSAAERVLAGEVRRGTGKIIRAVIWYCDMRDFTRISDQASPEDLVALLDDYFERVSGAVEDEGGEVLKFIGDAMLAIFPVAEAGVEQACGSAMRAARDALERLADTSHRAGIALHVGDVMFGNIGGRDRLDFTAIGAAVNMVCRVEEQCKEFGVPLLMTSAFVAHWSDDKIRTVGERTLRGVSQPATLFTLASLTKAPS